MSSYRKILLNSLAILALISFSLEGKGETQRDFQTWLNLTVNSYFNKESTSFSRFKYWLEGQERIGDDASRSSQIVLRTGLGYEVISNLTLWVGYAWIKTGLPFSAQPFIENRIWQQLLWTKKTSRWTFTSRTRTEQRFSKRNDQVAYRIRQQFKIVIPFKNHPKFSFVSHDEVFWHHNDFIGRNGQGFDQNRFFIGMGYKFNPKLSTEMGYMNQFIKRYGPPNFQSNILSITCYVNF